MLTRNPHVVSLVPRESDRPIHESFDQYFESDSQRTPPGVDDTFTPRRDYALERFRGDFGVSSHAVRGRVSCFYAGPRKGRRCIYGQTTYCLWIPWLWCVLGIW